MEVVTFKEIVEILSTVSRWYVFSFGCPTQALGSSQVFYKAIFNCFFSFGSPAAHSYDVSLGKTLQLLPRQERSDSFLE